MLDQDLVDRFWSYVVQRPGCWEWSASVGSHGYGQLSYKGSKRTAHTLSWEIHFGSVPLGLCVLHTCDNRRCSNPVHLFLGTKADNLEDMTKKGRRVRGETHGRRKLTEKQAWAIINAPGFHKDIAKEFGVSGALVSKIKSGQLWAHLRRQK